VYEATAASKQLAQRDEIFPVHARTSLSADGSANCTTLTGEKFARRRRSDLVRLTDRTHGGISGKG
jgi:hypothetical protein